MPKVYAHSSIRDIRRLLKEVIEKLHKGIRISDLLKSHIEVLWTGYQVGDTAICLEVSNHHADLIGASNERIFAHKLVQEDFEDIVLSEYGYMSWVDVQQSGTLNRAFELAVDLMLTGNLSGLEKILDKHPEVLSQSSNFGHKAGLIHYLSANGTELFRQIIPNNALDILDLLLELGADPNQPNNIYGGSDLISLIESSEHTFNAGLADDMIMRLQSL
jgi:hypothetical protein